MRGCRASGAAPPGDRSVRGAALDAEVVQLTDDVVGAVVVVADEDGVELVVEGPGDGVGGRAG